jgi:hypothetical protein
MLSHHHAQCYFDGAMLSREENNPAAIIASCASQKMKQPLFPCRMENIFRRELPNFTDLLPKGSCECTPYESVMIILYLHSTNGACWKLYIANTLHGFEPKFDFCLKLTIPTQRKRNTFCSHLAKTVWAEAQSKCTK